jgi:hypothetical protein
MANPHQIIRADSEGRCTRCTECGKAVNVTTRGRLFVHSALPVAIGSPLFTPSTCSGSKTRVMRP